MTSVGFESSLRPEFEMAFFVLHLEWRLRFGKLFSSSNLNCILGFESSFNHEFDMSSVFESSPNLEFVSSLLGFEISLCPEFETTLLGFEGSHHSEF